MTRSCATIVGSSSKTYRSAPSSAQRTDRRYDPLGAAIVSGASAAGSRSPPRGPPTNSMTAAVGAGAVDVSKGRHLMVGHRASLHR